MKRSMIFLTVMMMTATLGVVGRIDAALSSSGDAIAFALMASASAAPMAAGPMNWGFAARFDANAPVIQ